MDPALFDELLASVREGGQILRGEATAARRYTVAVPTKPASTQRAGARAGRGTQAGDDIDVAALRARLNLSQAKFAALLGISARTLEGWEQQRRRPDGPARVLLRVAARHPEAVLDTVR